MMRARPFDYHAPATLAEAAKLLAEHGPKAVVLAGGTDLVPNLKRRQFGPEVVISLRNIPGLRETRRAKDGSTILGSGLTLTELAASPDPTRRALTRAASHVATPLIRNTATLGGNLCVDTRCNYYNQNAEWRASISFCKKAPGPAGVAIEKVVKDDDATCWVAPSSPRCWAVSSTDTGPALQALGASVVLFSHKNGERTVPLDDFYNDDGMAFINRRPDEIMTSVVVPSKSALKSTYWKLRRRGSFDFPVMSVAAAVELAPDGKVVSAKIILGAIASCPLPLPAAADLVGRPLTDDAIDRAAEAAAKLATPLDNTDFVFSWRKKAVRTFVEGTLKELRGDRPESFGLLARRASREVPASFAEALV